MQHDAMIATLEGRKLYRVDHAIDGPAKQGSSAHQYVDSILDSLLKAEGAESEVHSLGYRGRVARLPVYPDLSAFDFGHSVVNEALVRSLHRDLFIDNAKKSLPHRWSRSGQNTPCRSSNRAGHHAFTPVCVSFRQSSLSMRWNW
jgi:hypothetical protein